MPWFFVDDAFADSRPVMALDRSLRNEAVGLWLRCGVWSAKEETDGRVPLDIVKGFGGSPRLIKALHESAQLWVKISPESGPKSGPKSGQNLTEIQFKNWEKWQKTRAENEARRKREAEKKQTWRAGKKGRDYVTSSDDSEMSTGDMSVDIERDSKSVSTGDTPGESTGVSRYPDPTRPDPTRSLSLVTSSGGVTSVDANAPEPPRFCPEHPNDTTERCIPCKQARMAHKAWVDAAPAREADRAKAAKAARENCPRCKGTNTYEDERGGVHPCRPHQEARNA